MSPTPVTFASPTQPATYSWEATNDEVARRYGVPIDQILRFDLNTSPHPPEFVFDVLAGRRFAAPLSEYPPGDYGTLVQAAAATYGVGTDELVVGAGADEVLELCAKAFLRPGETAIVPTPTYAMFRVVTEQRGANVAAVPRRGIDEGWRIDADAIREAARTASVVWLCSPNNPTGAAEPEGVIEQLLDDLAVDAAAEGRTSPTVVLDEAYAEFVERSLAELRYRHPNLVVIRTASKAYALAGLRVGFGIAVPDTAAVLNRYRPPGSVSNVSVTAVTEAFRRPDVMRANVDRILAERPRFAEALSDVGWRPGPSRTNFLLVDLGAPDRAARAAEGLLSRGLVPRTFGAGHPLAASLRITVRTPADNERFIQAAREIEAGVAGSWDEVTR